MVLFLPDFVPEKRSEKRKPTVRDSAIHNLETSFGAYPAHTESDWCPERDSQDVQDMVEDVPDHPNTWSDGSMEPIPHLDVEVAGAGGCTHAPACIFDNHGWRHEEDLDGQHDGFSIFSPPFPDPCKQSKEQNVGRGLSCSPFSGIHVGLDNLYVLGRGVRLPGQDDKGVPLSLVTDGDLLGTIRPMLRLWVMRLSKYLRSKGHADQFMVADGSVGQEDVIGNDGADTAADLGRLRQNAGATSSRRTFPPEIYAVSFFCLGGVN